MNSILEFIAEYEKLRETFPYLYVDIHERRKVWKVGVYARGMGIIGDAQLVSAESEDLDEAIQKAMISMPEIPNQINMLIEHKIQGRKLYVKRA